MHIYVFWRACTVPYLTRRIPRKFIIGSGFLLWAIFFFGRFFRHDITGTPAMLLELFGMNWMIVMLLTTVALCAVDVITCFGFILPRLAPTLRGMALITGVILSALALVQGLRAPVVSSYDVHLSGLSGEMDDTVIVAMSDLHLGSLIGERWLAARIEQVREQKPDIVFLLGDIFEGHSRSNDTFLPVMKKLTAPLGVWAVYGNHERYGRRETDRSLFKEAGFHELRNRWVEVRPGFVVAGVDNLRSDRPTGDGDDPVSKALSGRPPGATIFLSHKPWRYETAQEAGVGLMLSGHTHAGQVWPFGYLVKKEYPLFAGQYEVNGMTVIVCRGTGTWGPRMRLWRPGEILRITLHSDET